MDVSLVIPSFLAGLLTFLAPCTLPLVPGYLAFISGASLGDLKDPEKAGAARWKIFLNGLSFVIGFSLVFVVLGSLAGLAGSVLVPYRLWLGRVGGVFVITFGLFMLNVFKIPFLSREKRLKAPAIFERGPVREFSSYAVSDAPVPFWLKALRFLAGALLSLTGRGRPLNSFVLGSAFAFGWTPCVGPILGSILLLAATSVTVLKGALMLSIFSLGLAVPFLLIALGIGSASRYIGRISKYLNFVSVIGGLFLIFIGALLLTNRMALLVSYGYRWFKFINYERLLDYL